MSFNSNPTGLNNSSEFLPASVLMDMSNHQAAFHSHARSPERNLNIQAVNSNRTTDEPNVNTADTNVNATSTNVNANDLSVNAPVEQENPHNNRSSVIGVANNQRRRKPRSGLLNTIPATQSISTPAVQNNNNQNSTTEPNPVAEAIPLAKQSPITEQNPIAEQNVFSEQNLSGRQIPLNANNGSLGASLNLGENKSANVKPVINLVSDSEETLNEKPTRAKKRVQNNNNVASNLSKRVISKRANTDQNNSKASAAVKKASKRSKRRKINTSNNNNVPMDLHNNSMPAMNVNSDSNSVDSNSNSVSLNTNAVRSIRAVSVTSFDANYNANVRMIRGVLIRCNHCNITFKRNPFWTHPSTTTCTVNKQTVHYTHHVRNVCGDNCTTPGCVRLSAVADRYVWLAACVHCLRPLNCVVFQRHKCRNGRSWLSSGSVAELITFSLNSRNDKCDRRSCCTCFESINPMHSSVLNMLQ